MKVSGSEISVSTRAQDTFDSFRPVSVKLRIEKIPISISILFIIICVKIKFVNHSATAKPRRVINRPKNWRKSF
jgi:hypothetical protein